MQSQPEIDNIMNVNNNFNKELLQLLCEDSTDLQENDYENICLITNMFFSYYLMFYLT